MKPKHEDLVIPKEGEGDPFDNCKLDRKQYADILTDIVRIYSEGFVLAVNNKWGTGKTTFIKMWGQDLINKDFKTLYFNAWENDFEKDVLVALLAEIEVLRDTKAKAKFKSLLTKATPLMKAMGVGLTKGLSRKVGLDGVTEVIFDGIEKEINSYTTKKKGIQDFRDSLEAYVELIAKEKPVVFVIDELDRCRPNYAVEVLECVKHLFSVKGIVFVLAIDKEQLGHAVRGVYGSDQIDANEYLRRFIDLEYSIPEPNKEQYINYLYSYFQFDNFIKLPTRLRSSEFQADEGRIKKIAFMLYTKYDYSLRLIEKSFSRVRLVLKSFTENQFIFSEILILTSVLHEKFPLEYKGIKKKTFSLQQLTDKLDEILYSLLDVNSKRSVIFLMATFLYRYSLYCQEPNYSPNYELINYDDEGQEYLTISSRLDDQGVELLKAIQFYKNNFNTSDVSLDHILLKYDLTSNIFNK